MRLLRFHSRWMGWLLGWSLLLGCAGQRHPLWQEGSAPAPPAFSPRSAEEAFQRGREYFQDRDWSRAQAAFEQALKKDSQHTDSWLALAELYLQLQSPRQALRFIREAQKTAPESARVQRQCGFLYQAAGQLKGAEEAWRKALAQDPQDASLHRLLAQLLRSQERWDEAQAAAEKAVALDPSAASHQLLGTIYLHQGKPRLALDQFQATVKLQPDSAAAYIGCFDAWFALGNSAEAHRSLRRAQELAPHSASVLWKLGTLHEQEHRTDQAIEAYQKALEEDPNQAVAANNLAYLYLSRGENLEDALRWAELAYRQLPQKGETADTLGWIYHKLGKNREALLLLETAVQQLSQDPRVHYHLAAVYQALGRHPEARASARKALSLKDPFPGAEERRSRLQELAQSSASGKGPGNPASRR